MTTLVFGDRMVQYLENQGVYALKNGYREKRIENIALIALFVSIISISSYISLPFPIPFTMQTFGIFLTVLCLGYIKGGIAVSCYVVLGALGAPVFSGFSGGLAHLFTPTGGYIIGFIPSAFLTGWLISLANKSKRRELWSFVAVEIGNIVLYLSAIIFYIMFYTEGDMLSRIGVSFSLCCLPYILPDCLKNLLAVQIVRRVEKILK